MSAAAFWSDMSPDWINESFNRLVPSVQSDTIDEQTASATPAVKYAFLAQRLNERISELMDNEELIKPKEYFGQGSKSEALYLLAAIYDLVPDLVAAEKAWRASLAYSDPFKPHLSSLHNLARNLRLQNRFAESEAYWRMLIPLFQLQIGDKSPQALGAMRALIECVLLQGRVAEARALCVKTRALVDSMNEAMDDQRELKADEMEAIVDMETTVDTHMDN